MEVEPGSAHLPTVATRPFCCQRLLPQSLTLRPPYRASISWDDSINLDLNYAMQHLNSLSCALTSVHQQLHNLSGLLTTPPQSTLSPTDMCKTTRRNKPCSLFRGTAVQHNWH
ncbi:hypothetical protein EXN66_Car003633 [Channa argus]|uniref:Uncharacterized protein n=1 Tax=Channa argus TaxID=215402 RepID=A0A6G1PCD6_CHAAH|nr:hypothetical protein EXN66_Car003633 [Channa argus]